MSSTPSIRVSEHHRRSRPGTPPPNPPLSMAIPNLRQAVPPPLPPPALIPDLGAGHDPGWQWGNDPNSADFGRPASVKPGSSLLGDAGGGLRKFWQERGSAGEYGAFANRRGSSISTVTPVSQDSDMKDNHSEDAGTSSSSHWRSNSSLQGERQLEQRTLENSSQAYDKQLLSRIGGPNTPKRQSASYPLGSAQEIAQLAHADSERRNGQLRPLSMPERRHGSMESPESTRWPPSMPSSGAVSPGFTGFWEQGASDNSRIQTRHSSLQFDDAHSHRGSFDHSMFVHEDFPMEDGNIGSLNLHERSPSGSDDSFAKSGVKRRASSPARDLVREDRMSVHSLQGQTDLLHRRSVQQASSRGSPVSRFHPTHSSISSASSYGPRHGSFGSSHGFSSIPSSATSYASGRASPNGFSPGMDHDLRAGTPYTQGKLLASAVVTSGSHQQRTFSSSAQGGMGKVLNDSIMHSRHNSATQIPGIYLCECCPKKPKKFDTNDELRLHEAEKQYTCAYCPNRFKNKNEAERHQNSLHLRRHSWSCAALLGVEAAFHSSSSGSGMDACGYCGEEFPNPPRWDVRADHLNHVHKFGECNQTKKFFRADHFRQHLKHSHSGTSGKWTNMLETACMKDEPPPEKRISTVAVVEPAAGSSPALMVSTTGLQGHQSGTHAVIQETPHDS